MSPNIDWSIKLFDATLVGSKVYNGSIRCAQWGKLVRLNFNDLRFRNINSPIEIIATGLPPVAPGTGDTGIISVYGENTLPTLRMVVNESGQLALNYNASVSTTNYYGGFMTYFCQ